MLPLQLASLEATQSLLGQVRYYGQYKRYHVCGNRLGYYVVQPNEQELVMFAGQVVYLASPQDAGLLIDLLLIPDTAAKPKKNAQTRVKATSTSAKKRTTRTSKKGTKKEPI